MLKSKAFEYNKKDLSRLVRCYILNHKKICLKIDWWCLENPKQRVLVYKIVY